MNRPVAAAIRFACRTCLLAATLKPGPRLMIQVASGQPFRRMCRHEAASPAADDCPEFRATYLDALAGPAATPLSPSSQARLGRRR